MDVEGGGRGAVEALLLMAALDAEKGGGEGEGEGEGEGAWDIGGVTKIGGVVSPADW